MTGDSSQARGDQTDTNGPPSGGRLPRFSTCGTGKGPPSGLAVPGLRRRKFRDFLAYCYQKKLVGTLITPALFSRPIPSRTGRGGRKAHPRGFCRGGPVWPTCNLPEKKQGAHIGAPLQVSPLPVREEEGMREGPGVRGLRRLERRQPCQVGLAQTGEHHLPVFLLQAAGLEGDEGVQGLEPSGAPLAAVVGPGDGAGEIGRVLAGA